MTREGCESVGLGFRASVRRCWNTILVQRWQRLLTIAILFVAAHIALQVWLLSEWNFFKPRHLSFLEGALHREIPYKQKIELWSPLAPQGWKPCLPLTSITGNPMKLTGYIQVFVDGGLNQQRMGICDAVAIAKILNATLVIPYLETNPMWQDSSTFEEIYNVDHFINVLKDEISIVRELPSKFSWSTREYYDVATRATKIKVAPVHASANWYLDNVLPVLQSYGIAAISPFSHRLAFDNLPKELQRLRCKANFQALTFVPHINALGEMLIKRLRHHKRPDEHLREIVDEHGLHGSGKFAVLHLRFDKDIAAKSACYFGGGKAEILDLAKYRKYRQVIWQGGVVNSQYTDGQLRMFGRCPLTPEEIGLLLSALGFDSQTRLYLASHKVYGGEARISSLRRLFPYMEDKKSLATPEELVRVEGKASLIAAVDYYVSIQSDIFISASPGNMHNVMAGHRTYLNLKTIRPNMDLLGKLFFNKSFINKNLEWLEFQQLVYKGHIDRQGQIQIREPKQSIYTYPAPDCMCEVSMYKTKEHFIAH